MICPVVFFFGFFFISASRGDEHESCYMSDEMEDNCAAVIYPIVKPMLRYFEICQGKDAKYSQLQDKYTELLEKNSNLLLKLNEVSRQYEESQSNYQKKNLELEHLKAQMTKSTTQTEALSDRSHQFEESQSNNQKKDLELEHLKAQMTNSTTDHKVDNKTINSLALSDRCHPTLNNQLVVQNIRIPDSESFKVICHTSRKTGYTYMMVYRKIFNSSKFNRTFEEYASGFGNVHPHYNEEFFIGLESLHLLTNRNPHKLFIFMYSSGHTKEMKCENFVLGTQSDGYIVKTLNGCTGDISILSQGIKFSTFDRYEDENKATKLGLGWWFDSRIETKTLNYALVVKIVRKN